MSSPNGHRETHAMATEFRMHSINGNTQPGISTLIFPQLTSQQAKSVGLNLKPVTSNWKSNTRNEFCIPQNPMLEVLHIKNNIFLRSIFFMVAILNFCGFH